MRTLVLGGTGWLGHVVAERLVDRGDDVTCLARGTSGTVPTGARLVVADRDTPDAYRGVHGDWDEVVDLASSAEQVRSATTALADRAAHWTFVSTVSVYADHGRPGADETAALVEPRDPDGYADAKVLAERACAERLGDRLLIARAGLLVGRGDPTDRFGYWPARFARPGTVLLPDPVDRTVQVLDVADLAAWLADAAPTGRTGVVDAVGQVLPMPAVTAAAARVAGHRDGTTTAPDTILHELGVAHWAGPRSLPLWLPRDHAGLAARSGRRFRDLGGRTRPIEETLADVLDDERRRGLLRPRRAGLTPDEEAEVLGHLRHTR
ncbi:reductase [Curtobacterium sp. 'Ferrero']|uniref:NAD-dependent epimerase/dehydratase family protein n=1 Tax=Curtobacterium sp. 'Ferrero' TaxID=2033654 RepID=UPI000BD08970|nr:NAD-dependent epimerase/dehydratase family protein [Curtobacterium sp. 'Ferrero']PCN47668.1 reductase [Curtobacterium sp. 'Ferrero']